MNVPVVWAPNSTAGKLAVLLREFDRDPHGIGHRIRQMLEAGREEFRNAAGEFLKNPEESAAYYYLVSLLAAEGMLLSILCESELNFSQLAAAARAALRCDPAADLKIARGMAENLIGNHGAIPVKNATRLLEVLDQISDIRRIAPPLMRLLRHPNPELRSKAIKVIGRGSRSAKWVQGRLSETDSRVRANAIESLNGVDTVEARDLLHASIHDPDNRVAGNALVALHQLGETEILGDFFLIAAEKSPRFRATAAWAMGQTRDPRFSEALARLMQDAEASVRSRAFHGLAQIKCASANARKAAPWNIAGAVRDNPDSSQRTLRLAVVSADGSTPPPLLGTHVIVSEDNRRILSYRFIARPPAESISLSFVFPRLESPTTPPWVRGALDCCIFKRSSDYWRVIQYIPTQKPDGNRGAGEERTSFTADLEAVRSALLHPSEPAECGDFWASVRRATVEHDVCPGKRHVIIFNCSEELAPPRDEVLAPSARMGHVQVISSVRCAALEDFCRQANGAFYVAASDEDLAPLIRNCYLVLLANYDLVYTPVARQCRNVKVQVQTSSGWGEAQIPVVG